MNFSFKSSNIILIVTAVGLATLLASTTFKNKNAKRKEVQCCSNPAINHVCIMKTILGTDTSKTSALISTFKTPELVELSIKKALLWMKNAQAADGGWGAGSHSDRKSVV